MTGQDPQSLTPEQLARGSIAELAAGRLPLTSQWRVDTQRRAAAEGRATFTSGLSVDEFAVLRSAGFVPVGQVMGSAVYNVGWSFTGCGYRGGLFTNYRPTPVVDVPATRQIMEEARHRALDRLRQECAGLGGDGVIGVQVSVGQFYGNGLEFVVMGTAVRSLGPTRPAVPFTSDLSGQDFAKLVLAGWLPTALVMGVGVALRHDDLALMWQQRSPFNQELPGPTQLVATVRGAARASLQADVRRRGGHTAVLREMTVDINEVSCRRGGQDSRDHLADAFLLGTALVALPGHDPGAPAAGAPGAGAGAPAAGVPISIRRLDGRPDRREP